MEEFVFEEMAKTESKLSVGLFGPSGSGKTTSALKIAKGIRDQLYPGEDLAKIGLFIDTERRSSTKVVGRTVGGESVEPMELYCFEPPYDVVKLANLVEFATERRGKKIIVVDSYTHFWSGMDGILDRVAELEVELAGNKKLYGAWSEKEIVSKKNILKNLMSSSKCHLIFCFRAKTEYVIETNARGKQTPKAIGVKEDMQQDVRYEFDVVYSIDKDTHEASVVKDRIGYKEIRDTQENPYAPITSEDGKTLAKLVAEGLSLEEVAKRKMETYKRFILNEKEHKSSKVTLFEKSKGIEITTSWLDTLTYDLLEKLVNFLH